MHAVPDGGAALATLRGGLRGGFGAQIGVGMVGVGAVSREFCGTPSRRSMCCSL